ncbi:hypothetical protein CEXT_611671 [Caerostris extrusa]|uniref:Uncharacterized protein n=1 Tax=Caerostris extrusa TaxID=172846 RepID=A0AAV4TT75_CAEEX|nr:hypothetical protein CEXT_611671 [Caerostris extrusa]
MHTREEFKTRISKKEREEEEDNFTCTVDSSLSSNSLTFSRSSLIVTSAKIRNTQAQNDAQSRKRAAISSSKRQNGLHVVSKHTTGCPATNYPNDEVIHDGYYRRHLPIIDLLRTSRLSGQLHISLPTPLVGGDEEKRVQEGVGGMGRNP